MTATAAKLRELAQADLWVMNDAKDQVERAARLAATAPALARLVVTLSEALADRIEEPEDGVLVFYGGLQKLDNGDFTNEGRETLFYSFLEWAESHGLAYGGSLISPPTPDSNIALKALAAVEELEL